MSQITAISDDSFEKDVLESNIPVLVDFWATWCSPCKAIAPVLDDLSEKFGGRVKFVKLDVEQNPATPPKFGVRGVPTLILFVDGQVKATQIGMIEKNELKELIDTNI
jgi:thioredoxin 1